MPLDKTTFATSKLQKNKGGTIHFYFLPTEDKLT